MRCTHRFPDRTDRVILDSSLGPHYIWRAALRMTGLGGDLRFPDFAAYAAARNAIYRSTPQAVAQTYFRLLRQAQPVTLPDGTVIDGSALFREETYGLLYDDSDFPSLLALGERWPKAASRRLLPAARSLAADPIRSTTQQPRSSPSCVTTHSGRGR